MSNASRADHDRLPVLMAPDRRGSPRALAVYKVVKVECDGGEGLARCRNISDSGMKLDIGIPLSLDDELTVEFGPDTVLSGRVVWTNGDQCGVAFDHNIDCAKLLELSADAKRQDGARNHRLATHLPAQIVVDGKAKATTIANISQQGMMVTHKGEFKRGLHVKVLLDDGTAKSAIVQWSNDNFAGLFLFDHFSVMELGDIQSMVRTRT